MTAIDVGARNRSDLLYLAIDMPGTPTFGQFANEVSDLNTMVRYCFHVIRREPPHTSPTTDAVERRSPRRSGAEELVVVRTSMASPWVTVLGDVARNSAPIAYGMSVLYGLHKLMNMIMEWQTHKQNLSERRMTAGEVIGDFEAAITKEEREMGVFPGSRIANDIRYSAIDAAPRMNDVTAAEIISPDDLRAQGG
jgi:hypothetical protein